MRNPTLAILLALHYQGGTVHQAAEEAGLEVGQILDMDPHAFKNGDMTSQESIDFSIGMHHAERGECKLIDKRFRTLAFWNGAVYYIYKSGMMG